MIWSMCLMAVHVESKSKSEWTPVFSLSQLKHQIMAHGILPNNFRNTISWMKPIAELYALNPIVVPKPYRQDSYNVWSVPIEIALKSDISRCQSDPEASPFYKIKIINKPYIILIENFWSISQQIALFTRVLRGGARCTPAWPTKKSEALAAWYAYYTRHTLLSKSITDAITDIYT